MIAHQDNIHQTSFNFYGTVLAVIILLVVADRKTCSSDHEVKLFHVKEDGTFQQTLAFKVTQNLIGQAHDAAVTLVAWSHPEFGSLLATAGLDNAIKIWDVSGKSVVEKHRIAVPKVVSSLSFLPHFCGLKLIAGTMDSRVLVFDCMDYIHWSVEHDFPVGDRSDCETLVSLCSNRTRPASFVVANGNTVRVYSLDTVHNKFFPLSEPYKMREVVSAVSWSPNLGKSFEIIAVGTKDGNVAIYKLQDKELQVTSQIHHPSTITRLEWNITGTILTTVANESMKLWKPDYFGKEWRCVKTVD